jgi:hypothetical protein
MSPFSVCLTFSSWVFPSSPHRSASSYLASLISCLLASLISLIFLLLFHFTPLARFLPRVARFVGNTGKTLVQERIRPRPESHQIAEPHVGNLVRHNTCYSLFVLVGRIVRVPQECCFSESDQSPVLHCTGRKIWNRD